MAAASVPGVGSLLQNPGVKREDVKKTADNYVDFFDKSKGFTEKERKENYETVVNSYYDLATDFYEYGWGQSFHFAVQAKGEPLKQAIARHEHFLALRLQLRPGDRVLDCGCGVGGPAREIARFSGAHVTGINNNAYQVGRAVKHTEAQGLQSRCSFVKGNFMQIPADANTYDAVYAIEATCHAPDKAGVYGEIFRVLKPGQCFAAYEWCMTDRYDPANEHHRAIKLGVEEGDGIPDLSTTAHVVDVLKQVGFEIIEARDLVTDGEIPWYQPLVGGWSLENIRASKAGRLVTTIMVNVLETLRLAPKGTTKTHDFLIKAADSLVEGGKLGIFTPMFFFQVRKPARK